MHYLSLLCNIYKWWKEDLTYVCWQTEFLVSGQARTSRSHLNFLEMLSFGKNRLKKELSLIGNLALCNCCLALPGKRTYKKCIQKSQDKPDGLIFSSIFYLPSSWDIWFSTIQFFSPSMMKINSEMCMLWCVKYLVNMNLMKLTMTEHSGTIY